MSGRPNRHFAMTRPEQYDPSFAMYENTFHPFQRPGGPPQFDGVGFWYRPEQPETTFEHNTMLYNQSMPLANSPLEQSASIKHRRTRSGCFTCRHRRVKCDETRPVCERCQKGNRDCHFPQPSSASRRVDTNESRNMQNKLGLQEAKAEHSHTLSTIDDDSDNEKEESTSPTSGRSQPDLDSPTVQSSKLANEHYRRQGRANTAETKEEQSPESVGTTSVHSRAGTPISAANTPPTTERHLAKSPKWKHLNPMMQQYLQFHHDHITRYHYFLKLELNDFVHNELIDMALSFEPLLYAVVGFAAYHHTLRKPDGQFQDFWKYYCQSIMLLRKWLERHTDRNEAVLLTILQLSTFEEYLGDWAGLASHQKAAHSIFSTLYTYENVMETVTSRYIFDWLARADVAVSLMAGTTTFLERQWFLSALDWHRMRMNPDGMEAGTALPCFVAKLRLIGFDMATVFARAISSPSTMQNIRTISKRMEDLRIEIQTLHETTHSARSIARGSKGGAVTEDAFDPRIPLFHGNLWPLNFVWVDWYAAEQMHRYQTVLFIQSMQTRTQYHRQRERNASVDQHSKLQNLLPELEKISSIQCQMVEAIERHPRAPAGAILGCQASLGLAMVFLKKEPKYIMWARKKLANVERMGYIWPPSFRKRMSQLWDDDEVLDWWLPNGEHKIDLLDEIREVVEERNKEIEGRGGDARDDVREIKAIFENLDFGKRSLRTRKDSVWSASGVEKRVGAKMSSTDESENSEDEHSDDARHLQRHGRESGGNGVGSSSATARRGQPTLEYSNRMSGVWEGPVPTGH